MPAWLPINGAVTYPSEGPSIKNLTLTISARCSREAPDLALPPYMLIVSFGLVRITLADGPIQIAPGTHRIPKERAIRAVQSAEIEMGSVPLEIGDVLIRHPWALHRGTPNTRDTPRALVTIR